MGRDIKVSILITFYNQKEYVDRALQSVYDQQVDFNFEVIIGDDGSNDGTVEKIHEWQARFPNILLFVMPRNEGKHIPGFRASRNRLNILKHVRGEYFIFLDGDDYFSDCNKLQKQISILDKEENNDCVVCAHRINIINEEGQVRTTNSDIPNNCKLSFSNYWGRHYIHTDTMLIRSSIIPNIRDDIMIDTFNDTMITYAILQFGKLYFLGESMAVYDQRTGGFYVTSSSIERLIRELMDYDTAVKINPKAKKENRRAFAQQWEAIGKRYKEIDFESFGRFLEESKRLQFRNTADWINYSNLSQISKFLLWFRRFQIVGLYRIKVILLKGKIVNQIIHKVRS